MQIMAEPIKQVIDIQFRGYLALVDFNQKNNPLPYFHPDSSEIED